MFSVASEQTVHEAVCSVENKNNEIFLYLSGITDPPLLGLSDFLSDLFMINKVAEGKIEVNTVRGFIKCISEHSGARRPGVGLFREAIP